MRKEWFILFQINEEGLDNMKKVLALTLAVLMLFTVIACGAKTSDTAASSPAATASQAAGNTAPATSASAAAESAAPAWDYKDKTLTIALDSEPDSLVAQTGIPFLGAMYPLNSLYAHLYEYDENSQYSPSLATGYKWIDDTHYELYIREDAYASNGEQITAEDVVYSFALGAEGNNAKSYTTYDVANCTVKDKFTAVMALASPSPTATDVLYDLPLTIVSKSGIESSGGMTVAARDPSQCTTGRYNFVEWKEGQYILTKYNENYFDKSYVPSYEYIKYVFVTDSASRCMSVQSGDVDIAANISLADTKGYTSATDVKVATYASQNDIMFWFNCSNGIFTNQDLRKAISYLVDWQACCDLMTGGGKTPNPISFASTNPYYYDQYDRTLDIEKGKELMAKAGYPDGFDFTITVEPSNGYQNVAVLIQSYLAEVGCNVTVNPIDYAAWFDTINKADFDCYVGTAAGPLLFATAYYDDVNTRIFNFGGPQISDPQVTEWVNTARTTFDFDERLEALTNIQKYGIENNIGYGICDICTYALYSVNVKDISNAAGQLFPYFVRPAT